MRNMLFHIFILNSFSCVILWLRSAAHYYNSPPPITRTVTQVFPVKIVPGSRDVNMGRNGKGMFYFHYFKEYVRFLQKRRM